MNNTVISLNNEIFSIYSKVEQNLFLEKTNSNNVILSEGTNGENKKWYLKYDASKDSYIILSEEDTSLALTLEYPSLKLVAKVLDSLTEQYWFIKRQNDSNTFTISNYKNPNLYLSISSDKQLVISTVNTSDNIKFIFRQPIIDELNNKVFRLTNKLDNLSIMRGSDGIPVQVNYNKQNPGGIPDDVLVNINRKFAWQFESVDNMFGIFKLKNIEKSVYLGCTDKPYVETILPGIIEGDNIKWKVYFRNKDVIMLVNIATNGVLISDGIGLKTINNSSAGTERFWNLDSIKI
ncbi:hypothetical protein [Clostridium cuniculi]|uniref:hypothetical protein n=1 Tax=Clostridium cuniculi TaxID=2548455 RepID=UPI0010553A33|nr:hypothetical protein [Clostridium cuniculi]